MEFYIARNTPLRSIDGILHLSTRHGNVLNEEAMRVDFVGTDYGMLAAELGFEPAYGTTCRDLTVSLEIKHCRGSGGGLIACPEVRVKVPKVFAGLAVSGEGLNICND